MILNLKHNDKGMLSEVSIHTETGDQVSVRDFTTFETLDVERADGGPRTCVYLRRGTIKALADSDNEVQGFVSKVVAILREEDSIARTRSDCMEAQASRTVVTMVAEKLAALFQANDPGFNRTDFFTSIYREEASGEDS